ncbi:MAG: hypothetical protein ACXWDO_11170 [Bacteroidia bacterium]
MKRLFYAFLLLSIFCTSHICNAQSAGYTVQLCNHREGNITKSQLMQMANSTCNSLLIFDAEGNEMKLKEFVVAAVPANKKNSFWSMETLPWLTQKQKQLLSKLTVGDEFLVQDVVLQQGDDLVKVETPFRFNIVE